MAVSFPLISKDFKPQGKKKAFMARVDPELHRAITWLVKITGCKSNSVFLESLFYELAIGNIREAITDRYITFILEKIQKYGVDLEVLIQEIEDEKMGISVEERWVDNMSFPEKYYQKYDSCLNARLTGDSSAIPEGVTGDLHPIQMTVNMPDSPIQENNISSKYQYNLMDRVEFLEPEIMQSENEEIQNLRARITQLEAENLSLKTEDNILTEIVQLSIDHIRQNLSKHNPGMDIFSLEFWYEVFMYFQDEVKRKYGILPKPQ